MSLSQRLSSKPDPGVQFWPLDNIPSFKVLWEMLWEGVCRGGRGIVYLLLCLCRLRQWWLLCGSHWQFKPRAGLDGNKKIDSQIICQRFTISSVKELQTTKQTFSQLNLAHRKWTSPSPLFAFWCSAIMYTKMTIKYVAHPSACKIFWNVKPCDPTALVASDHHSRVLLVTPWRGAAPYPQISTTN